VLLNSGDLSVDRCRFERGGLPAQPKLGLLPQRRTVHLPADPAARVVVRRAADVGAKSVLALTAYEKAEVEERGKTFFGRGKTQRVDEMAKPERPS